MKLSAQQLEAVLRLRSNQDFKTFEGVLREYERDMTERLIGSTDQMVTARTQGAIHGVRAIQALIGEAPDTFIKLYGK